MDSISPAVLKHESSTYERRINLARIVVALAFGICGAGVVISAHRIDRNAIVPGETSPWQYVTVAFGMGMLLCLALTLTLVFEGIVRFCIELRGGSRFQFSLRTLLIVMTLLAVLGGLIASIAT